MASWRFSFAAVCGWMFFTLAFCISDRSLKVIEEKENIVKNIAARAADLYQRRTFAVSNCECSHHSCAYEFPEAKCHKELGGLSSLCGEDCEGQLINYNQSIIRMPPGTDPDSMSASLKESICTYRDLDLYFVGLYPSAYTWTYFGTTDGHFRRWPAAGRTHNENGEPLLGGCAPYDPRLRPWYVAASTGPKDIVFVIDKSGSMLDTPTGGDIVKWNTTTDAVLALIDTLGSADYFNIVAFSDEAEQLWTESSLAQGLEENRNLVKDLLTRQIPDGGTNFDAAFQLAFDLLTEACNAERVKCSGCEKVIIFLTDGKDTSRSSEGSIRPSEMAIRIAEYQDALEAETSRRASIFTFSMGSDADDSIPRQIACSNSGSWSFIGDRDDPLTAMESFYSFLTARRVSASPIWAHPYPDNSGLGLITTVAVPTFSQGVGELSGVFLGVAGHDVFLTELGESEEEQDEAFDELLHRGLRCDPFITDACQLQVLRNLHASQATCVDRFPIISSPNENEKPQCFTNGRSFYKRFSASVTWDEALERCEDDDGQLVSVGSEDELTFVASMASDDGSWIGARRSFASFTWQDNSSPEISESSDYWGIGQPGRFPGVEDCATIDTRGPIGNLNAEDCDKRFTFICEYEDDSTCRGRILNPRDEDEGYFQVPSLDLCVNAESSLSRTNPVSAAKSLNREDVMCPLGNETDDVHFRCCPECIEHLSKTQSDDFGSNNNSNSDATLNSSEEESDNSSNSSSEDDGVSGLAVIIIVVGIIVVALCVFVGAVVFMSTRQNKKVLAQKSAPVIQSPEGDHIDVSSRVSVRMSTPVTEESYDETEA